MNTLAWRAARVLQPIDQIWSAAAEEATEAVKRCVPLMAAFLDATIL